MVKQLLTLARSEGVNIIETTEIELGELVTDLSNYWRPVFAQNSKVLHLSTEIQSLSKFKFKTNPTLLKEILNNLIDNAFNYGGDRIDLKASQESDRLLLQVLDDGESVVAEDLEKMLTPFWRGKDLSHHGVGLGLPIAQKTCALLGGHLSIQIRPEVHGTQITIDLPLG